MTKICHTPEDIAAHTAVIEDWFSPDDGTSYEVVQRWDDGYSGYWVILRTEMWQHSVNDQTTLYCIRTFEVAGRIQISIDVQKNL